LVGWFLFSLGDAIVGLNTMNPDTYVPDQRLVWYRRLTMIWAPLQFATLFGIIWVVTSSDHLAALEKNLPVFWHGGYHWHHRSKLLA
jgi:alkane 1-monooxygenase